MGECGDDKKRWMWLGYEAWMMLEKIGVIERGGWLEVGELCRVEGTDEDAGDGERRTDEWAERSCGVAEIRGGRDITYDMEVKGVDRKQLHGCRYGRWEGLNLRYKCQSEKSPQKAVAGL